MRVVVALGGNALLRRGEPLTAENQRSNVGVACEALAPIALEHGLIVTHGNGPQIGLLALQSASYEEVDEYPLYLLGAQTEGQIGYMIEQGLGNLLPIETPLATILTMVEVDPEDPAFQNPTKPIGPGYSEEDARRMAEERGWSIAKDGDMWRRVVPSPEPHRIFELRPIHWLLEKNTTVICAGGGGIPTVYNSDGELEGVEVVIDKSKTVTVSTPSTSLEVSESGVVVNNKGTEVLKVSDQTSFVGPSSSNRFAASSSAVTIKGPQIKIG